MAWKKAEKKPEVEKETAKPVEVKEEVVGKQLENVRLLPIDAIVPDPNQPRKIDPESEGILQLAKSIKEHGVMNPIHVVYLKDKNIYQIVNGERRYHASRKAELTEIPAIIMGEKEIKDEGDKAIKQLVDNLQREDLTPFEEADGYQQLIDKYNLQQKDISKKIGKAKNTISETMSLNKLTKEIKDEVLHAELDYDVRIPKRFLVNLSRIEDIEKQKSLLDQFMKKTTRKAPEKREAAPGKHLMSVAMKHKGENSQVMVWLPVGIPEKERGDNLVAALEEALDEAKKPK